MLLVGMYALGRIWQLTGTVPYLRTGGYVINSMRFEYLVTVPEYHRLERHMDELQQAGRWRRVDRYVTDRYFFETKQGITYIYQKL